MSGKYSESQKRATMKYMKSNYDRIQIKVRKGKKAKIEQMAASMGMSVNAMIESLIDAEAHRKGLDVSILPVPSQTDENN